MTLPISMAGGGGSVDANQGNQGLPDSVGSCRCGRAGLRGTSACLLLPRHGHIRGMGLFLGLGPGLGVRGPALNQEGRQEAEF